MTVIHYFIPFLIGVYFSFSVGQITNEKYASKNSTDHVVDKHPGLDGNASAPVNITEQPRLCQEETVGSLTPWYWTDDVSLNHYGTLRRDSTGRRAYFELHFALQTDDVVLIWLSETKKYLSGITYALYVGLDSPQRTKLLYGNGTSLQDIVTPDILSSTQSSSFYIKIDGGKLQFGKEGETPLISYGIDLNSFNCYRFRIWGGPTKIRYCPAAVEGSS